MNILYYVVGSGALIIIFHFVFPTRDFGLLQMIGVFIIGGIAGYYMQSIEIGFLISIILSLIFV